MDGKQLVRPEQKHAEASVARDSQINVHELPLFKAILEKINECQGVTSTAPILLYGYRTREYCIVPCPVGESERNVLRVVQEFRGSGWFIEPYRISESMTSPYTYRTALLVCWDPEVLIRTMSPKLYTPKEYRIAPCGTCSKHRDGNIAACEGCSTLRMWLPGVLRASKFTDPCEQCTQNRDLDKRGGVPSCDGCPAKDLWIRLQSNKDSDQNGSSDM